MHCVLALESLFLQLFQHGTVLHASLSERLGASSCWLRNEPHGFSLISPFPHRFHLITPHLHGCCEHPCTSPAWRINARGLFSIQESSRHFAIVLGVISTRPERAWLRKSAATRPRPALHCRTWATHGLCPVQPCLRPDLGHVICANHHTTTAIV
jgi:hypothetical protein